MAMVKVFSSLAAILAVASASVIPPASPIRRAVALTACSDPTGGQVICDAPIHNGVPTDPPYTDQQDFDDSISRVCNTQIQQSVDKQSGIFVTSPGTNNLALEWDLTCVISPKDCLTQYYRIVDTCNLREVEEYTILGGHISTPAFSFTVMRYGESAAGPGKLNVPKGSISRRKNDAAAWRNKRDTFDSSIVKRDDNDAAWRRAADATDTPHSLTVAPMVEAIARRSKRGETNIEAVAWKRSETHADAAAWREKRAETHTDAAAWRQKRSIPACEKNLASVAVQCLPTAITQIDARAQLGEQDAAWERGESNTAAAAWRRGVDAAAWKRDQQNTEAAAWKRGENTVRGKRAEQHVDAAAWRSRRGELDTDSAAWKREQSSVDAAAWRNKRDAARANQTYTTDIVSYCDNLDTTGADNRIFYLDSDQFYTEMNVVQQDCWLDANDCVAALQRLTETCDFGQTLESTQWVGGEIQTETLFINIFHMGQQSFDTTNFATNATNGTAQASADGASNDALQKQDDNCDCASDSTVSDFTCYPANPQNFVHRLDTLSTTKTAGSNYDFDIFEFCSAQMLDNSANFTQSYLDGDLSYTSAEIDNRACNITVDQCTKAFDRILDGCNLNRTVGDQEIAAGSFSNNEAAFYLYRFGPHAITATTGIAETHELAAAW